MAPGTEWDRMAASIILTSQWVEQNHRATPFFLSCFQNGDQCERFEIHLWSFQVTGTGQLSYSLLGMGVYSNESVGWGGRENKNY